MKRSKVKVTGLRKWLPLLVKYAGAAAAGVGLPVDRIAISQFSGFNPLVTQSCQNGNVE